MAGKQGMKWYSLETKREAIRLHEEEGKSYEEIAKLLDIKHRQRVGKWVREYRKAGEGTKKRGRPPKRENVEAYIARLEMENDLLKKFHAELRKLELAKRNIGSSTIKKKTTK